MRYLSLTEVLDLHRLVVAQTGGAEPVLDLRGLESAIAQPRATFEGRDLHPSLADKAAALCYSLILNHPFLDGNKRVGHAAMETFLMLNGYEVLSSVEESERLILDVASGQVSREDLAEWLKKHLAEVSGRR
ncbi:MAG TPA: type II toxin-antitoxin system death-on-curing family toxin [Candidatus Polarisedimenticolia bacterium]|nr:type II toxin-antitoxin system death-on-curing family toxin [Candidatus Polarisedimenticolia bacterium]